MAGREKRTWEDVYRDFHGTDVPAEKRGKKYQAWAEEKKQEQEEKANKRRRKNTQGTSGGRDF